MVSDRDSGIFAFASSRPNGVRCVQAIENGGTMTRQQRVPTICVAENRAWCEPGVRVLIASLADHSPTVPIELFYPGVRDAFLAWAAHYPQLSVNRYQVTGAWRAWNIKPEVLQTLLRNGHDEVLWIDSDVIVTRDIREIYAGLPADTAIVAEEALCSSHYDGDALRARSWGLPVGRRLPFQLNGGLMGYTTAHLPLLARWGEVLDSEPYLEALKLPWDQRPRHFMADQEVLTALLCSTEFTDIPLRFLRRGPDVIQYFGSAGYTLRERGRHLMRGMPYFIHSQGHKSWTPLPAEPHGFRAKMLHRYQQHSPYRAAAARYRDVLEDRSWLAEPGGEPRPQLTGAMIAAFFDAYRYVRWAHTGGEPRR